MKIEIKRAESFLNKIQQLQFDIYNFQNDLENKNNPAAEFAGNSGFELDTCRIEMENCLSKIKEYLKTN